MADGDFIPDDFFMEAGHGWLTSAVLDKTVFLSTDASVRFPSADATEVAMSTRPKALPCIPGDVVLGDWVIAQDNITAGYLIYCAIVWLDSNMDTVGSDQIFGDELPAVIGAGFDNWYRISGSATCPDGAAYAVLWVDRSAHGFNAWVDMMGIRKVQPGCFVSLTSDQSSSSGDVVNFDEEVYDYGGLYDAVNHKVIIPFDGPYSFSVGLAIKLLDTNETFQVQLNRKILGGTDGAYIFGARVHSPIDDDTNYVGLSFSGAFLRGDEVQIRAVHGHGSALNVAGKLTGSYTTYRSWLSVAKL